MAHVLVNVAARVIPEEAPVGIAVGVELALRGLAEERFPDDVLAGHVGINRARPLRLAVRRVAVHVRVNGGDLADIAGGEKVGGVGHLTGRTGLMADLHGALAGFLVGGAHALGVVDGERHGLFLIDVLAGIERGGEMLAMEMLRRGDQDGVDGFVVEQIAVVEIGLGVGRNQFGVFETLGIDIGEGDELGVGAGDGGFNVLHAAVAGADDAEADAVVGSQDVGNRERAGQAGSDFADEIAS